MPVASYDANRIRSVLTRFQQKWGKYKKRTINMFSSHEGKDRLGQLKIIISWAGLLNKVADRIAVPPGKPCKSRTANRVWVKKKIISPRTSECNIWPCRINNIACSRCPSWHACVKTNGLGQVETTIVCEITWSKQTWFQKK